MQSLPKSSRSKCDATGSSQKHADSLAKKRARDRRAQQNQRDKRNEQVKSLQEQLARMESRMLHLSRECEALRQENEQLRGLSGNGEQLVASQSRQMTPANTEVFESLYVNEDKGPVDVEDTSRSNLEFKSRWPSFDSSTPAASQAIESLAPRSTISPWTNTSAHAASAIVTELFKNWLERPDLICLSPRVPEPIDLLYGSKTNFLADFIHHSLRMWPCRDPERLAGSWLIYNLAKWMLDPSSESHWRLQEFQLPVSEQLERPHSQFIDFVFWPKLRANMVQYDNVYTPEAVLEMFLRCVKLRWPWGQSFLEPKEDGTPKMRQDFLETFTTLDGWGMTEDFFQKFPNLGHGLDINAMRYRIC